MATSFDRWEKDPIFLAVEEVQESADRMESVYRRWVQERKGGSAPEAAAPTGEWGRGAGELRRELHTALGTAKWQQQHRPVQSVPAMAGWSTSSAIPCLPKTSSRSVTRSVEATHDFEVSGYSLLDGLGVGEYVQSSTFTVDGCDWYIRFYADGDKKPESVGYASVYLHFHRGGGGPAVVQAKFSLSCLLREDGQVSELSGVATNCTCTFDPPDDMWGISRFVAKPRLRSSLGINNDCFTIRCVLAVIQESRSEDVTRAIAVPRPNLHQDLERMLKNGEDADVTFSVGGQLFPAHRCMLAARSPVFKAELSGSMAQKGTRWIKIDNVAPAIFEALLHFVYTDSLPDNYVEEGDTVAMLRLLDAADRYGLDRLKLICGSKLCENIDAGTAVTMLVSAERAAPLPAAPRSLCRIYGEASRSKLS